MQRAYPVLGHVCDFRFADLRHSGNLSLVVSDDGGGTEDCNYTSIIDKTASRFETYELEEVYADVFFTAEDSIKDINHDGNSELVVWTLIGPASDMREECTWPRIFAWTGNGYAEVSAHYRKFYTEYLKSLKQRLARQSTGGLPAAEPTPEPADDCTKIQAAKTEQLLGEHSDSMMTFAVKAAESNEPYDRELAAVILAYIATPEATSDLKTLASDTDSKVAEVANVLLKGGEFGEPLQTPATVMGEPVQWPERTIDGRRAQPGQ